MAKKMMSSTEGYRYYVAKMAQLGKVPVHKSNFDLKTRDGTFKGAKKVGKGHRKQWLIPVQTIENFAHTHKGGVLVPPGTVRGRPRKDGKKPQVRTLEERMNGAPSKAKTRGRKAKSKVTRQPAKVASAAKVNGSHAPERLGKFLVQTLVAKRPESTLRDLVEFMDNSVWGRALQDVKLTDIVG